MALPLCSHPDCPHSAPTHPPGSTYYDRVRIDADKGERCFASASEAELAGFRRAGG